MRLKLGRIAFCCITVSLLLVSSAGLARLSAATSTPTWLDSSATPDVSYGINMPSAAFENFRDEQGILSHALNNCTTETIPINQYGDTYTSCWANTNIGLIGENGYLFRPDGGDIAGCLNNCSTRLMPTSNPDVFFELVDEDGDTAHIALRTPETSQVIQILPAQADEISTLTWNSPPAYQPVDASNSVIAVDNNALYTSATVSQNGKWMLLWDPAGFFTRIDLTTFQALTVSLPSGDITSDLFSELDISDSGQYAAVAFTPDSGPRLRIFDLNGCNGETTSLMTTPIECDSQDFTSAMQAHDLYAFRLPVFYDDDLLGMHVRYDYDGSYNSYFLQAPNTIPDSDYLGLGDSYASGEGAFSYLAGTDNKDNKCHLSSLTYSFLVGIDLNLNSTHSVACSGAKVANVGNYAEEAQYDISKKPADAFSDYWIPGYKPQLDFIIDNRPDLVTISMGGNDIGFSEIIKRCIISGDTCFSTYEERLGLVKNINSKFEALANMYIQLKVEAAPGARIYVIGYPQIAKPDGNCGLNVRLNNDEIKFGEGLIGYLNYAIEQATRKAGVLYVDAEDAFGESTLCGNNSSLSPAINGLTAGGDIFSIIGNESYHPTPYGYYLMAQAIKKSTTALTAPMPSPDKSLEQPDDLNFLTLDFLGDAPQSGDPVRRQEFYSSPRVSPFTEGLVNGDLKGSDFLLQPNTQYDVWMHSDPVLLGTATTDGDGDLQYSFPVPPGTEPGFHTIDIYGTDTNGDPVAIQQIIYVAASENDWDGDGVPNNQELCGVFEPSGIDADHDRIDDACDPVIGKWSAVPPSGQSPAAPTQASSFPLYPSNTITPANAAPSPNSKNPASSQPSDEQNEGHRPPAKKQGGISKWLIVAGIVFVLAISPYAAVRLRHGKKS
jgi:lysophospholipase L1-like esterase